MAKATSKQTDFKRDSWKGFIERPLTDTELLACDEWECTDVALVENTVGLLAQGYKLTLSYKAETKTYTATLMAGDNQGKASGWGLSARSDTSRDAWKILLFKHFSILEQRWDDFVGATRSVQRG